jgi:hypothetical protein
MGHDTQDENSYAGQIDQRVPQAEPQTLGIHERLDQIQARIELAYRMSADVNLALRGRSDEHREMLKSALDRLERMEQASARSEERIHDEAFKRGVLIGREEAEADADGGPFALLAAGVHIPDGANTERERNAERRHREIIATALARSAATNVLEAITADVGPSDYEVWRDALQLTAVLWSGRESSAVLNADNRRRFIEAASWFQLNLGIPGGEGDPKPPSLDRRHAYSARDARDGRCRFCEAPHWDAIHEGDHEDDKIWPLPRSSANVDGWADDGEAEREDNHPDRHAYEQGDDGCTHCDADALDLIHEVHPLDRQHAYSGPEDDEEDG